MLVTGFSMMQQMSSSNTIMQTIVDEKAIVEACLPGFSGIFGSRLWAQILGQGFSRIDATAVETRGPMTNPATDHNAMVPVDKVRELVLAADRLKTKGSRQ